MTSSDGRTANEVHVHKLEKRSRYKRTRTRHKWRTDKHIRSTTNRRQQDKNRIRRGRHVARRGVVREVCVGIKQNQPPPHLTPTSLSQTSLLALSVPFFFTWILVSIWSNKLLIMNKTYERSLQGLPSASCRLACLQGGTRFCPRCLIVVPRDFWFRHFVKKFTWVCFFFANWNTLPVSHSWNSRLKTWRQYSYFISGENCRVWLLSQNSSFPRCFDVEYVYGFVGWGVCKQSRWRHSVTEP